MILYTILNGPYPILSQPPLTDSVAIALIGYVLCRAGGTILNQFGRNRPHRLSALRLADSVEKLIHRRLIGRLLIVHHNPLRDSRLLRLSPTHCLR